MRSIGQSIGQGGYNTSVEDIKTIQDLLNKVPPGSGGPNPKLDVEGKNWGANWNRTVSAIRAFQQARFGWADGRVDPNQKTIRELNTFDVAPTPTPTPTPTPVTPPAPTDPKAQAELDKGLSIIWAVKGMISIQAYLAYVVGGRTGTAADFAATEAAIATHFHIPQGSAEEVGDLSVILSNYAQVLITLNNSSATFRSRSLAEATADRGVDTAGVPYPAYTFYQSSINFTSSFLPFGPKCRAAMVLHEPVHYVDSQATTANDIYEHSPRYDTITAQQAIHNPSSYVCFAEQMVFNSDVRFGAGRPTE